MSDDELTPMPSRKANMDSEYTIVALPVRGLSEINRLPVDRLAKLLRHRVQFAMVLQPEKRIVIVINLMSGIKERGIAVLAGAFKKLEFLRKDRLAYLYILRPTNKKKGKFLKRLFGIKKGEQTVYLNQFKVVLLKTMSELHAYVDRGFLTEDYGGTVKYCHNSWFYFYKVISPVLHRAYDVMKSLTITRVKIQGLNEYDASNVQVEQLKTLLRDRREEYKLILVTYGINESIDECKRTIAKLEQPQEDNHLSRISPTLMANGLTALKRVHPSLETAKRDLEIVWMQTEEQFEMEIKLQQFKEDTDNLCNQIETRFYSQMSMHPSVGTTLSQAEIHRTHFTTVLFEPGKELVNNASMVLEEMKSAMEYCNPEWGHKAKETLMLLRDSIEPFVQKLNELNEIYIAIHVFFLIFQKALKWYHKTLQFIPQTITALTEVNGIKTSSFVATPTTWQKYVLSYLRKHPRPGEEHLIKLDTDVPPSLDAQTASDAKTLAYRLRMLFRLMDSTVVTVGLIFKVCDWKQELNQKSEKRLVIGKKLQPTDQVCLAQTETTDTEWSGSVNEVRHRGSSQQKRPSRPSQTIKTNERRRGCATKHITEAVSDDSYFCPPCSEKNDGVDMENKSQYTSEDDDVIEYIRTITASNIPSKYKAEKIRDFISDVPTVENQISYSEPLQLYHTDDRKRVSSVFTEERQRDIKITQRPIHRGSPNTQVYNGECSSSGQTVRRLKEKLGRSINNLLDLEVYKARKTNDIIKGKGFSIHSQPRVPEITENRSRMNCQNRFVVQSQHKDTDSESELETSTSDLQTLDQDAQRLLICRQNRLQEEFDLKLEWNRYSDILNQAESMYKENMGTSLRRAEALLKEIDDDIIPSTEQISFEELSDGAISELEDFYREEEPVLVAICNNPTRKVDTTNRSYKSSSTDLGYDSLNERISRNWYNKQDILSEV